MLTGRFFNASLFYKNRAFNRAKTLFLSDKGLMKAKTILLRVFGFCFVFISLHHAFTPFFSQIF